jgi:branched-chain amino acid transport system ATP-binding protein
MDMCPPSARPGPPLLQVTDLHVAYGKAHVVRGISFAVHPGEFVVLLGRNGAGKSTVLNAMSGLLPKQGGTVTFDGQDVSRASPAQIIQSGLVHVLEGHRVFTTLSVEDNILIGRFARKTSHARETLDRIYALFPEIAEKRHQQASRLSGGQQQILAVAQGLVANPRLLVLDEPSGGLAPIIVDRILDVAAGLAREGTAVLLVEQLVEKALRHADYGYLLDTGVLGGEGSASALENSELLRRIYLG